MSSFDHPIETLNLDDREKRKLIDGLKKNPSFTHEERRRNLRVPYNSTYVSVMITNPGGNVVRYSVIPRNLSRRGIGFLHGRFVYPDSRCKITLQTLDDENMTMDGAVVRCDHLAGTIHEVAVLFNSPIDLTLFANLTPAELEGHTEEYENDVSTGQIERGPVEMGTVLLVDGYTVDRRLYSALLGRAGYLCREAGNTQEAIGVINNYEVDAAVIDVSYEPEYGITLIEHLLASEFKGAILAVSADDHAQVQQSAMSAGAQQFIPKPIDAEHFVSQINQMVGNDASGGGGDAILSSLAHDESMKHLLRGFITDAREIATTIRSAARVSDSDQLKLICRQLKGAGGSYGFDEVSRSASEVIEVLEQSAEDVQVQQAMVEDLLDVLSRIRVG